MNDDTETILLLAEACSNDRAGMERLAARVRERLYPYVFRMTLNSDTTEDILQETLVAMIGGVKSLRDHKRFWPWMYRIAWSKIQDSLRQRQMQTSVKDTFLQNHSHPGWAHNEHASVLEAQVKQETLRQVNQAVDGLDARHRDIVHLRCYEQLEYTEIASRTHTTPQRARVQYHRAKESLKARLLCCV